MGCVSPLKGFKNLDTGGIQFRRDGRAGEKMEVACGQCLTCRVDYSRMWAMRIVHESGLFQYSGGNSFITLTYRSRNECTYDELENGYHVPDDWSLHKKHFQDFMKRLRKHFAPQKIRYFMCGEYGEVCKHGLELDRVSCPLCNVGRPHYHACLFNCDFSDLESYAQQDGVVRWTSPTLEKIWKYGFVDVGEVNFDSAAYVAGYVLKKVTGIRAEDWYFSSTLDGEFITVQPEFVLMSRRPGIGKDWYERYESDFFPADESPVSGKGIIKSVPRYYEELYKRKDPASLEEIKKLREKFKKEHSADYTPERLYSKYKVAKAKMKLFGGKL